jgi:hypothetical protein
MMETPARRAMSFSRIIAVRRGRWFRRYSVIE